MAVLYTPHFVQFFDNNGDPLNGGKLYTYAAGTVMPKATYTNEGGATPNANPIVLDSAGRSVVFLSGSYKFRLEDSLGNLIRETDNVTAFSTQESTVDDIVANFTEDVVATADSFIFADASDGNTTKRDTIQGILDLAKTYILPFFDFTSASVSVGTGVDISLSSIPSGVKRVEISLNQVSNTNNNNANTGDLVLQLGSVDGFEVTGYKGTSAFIGTSQSQRTDSIPLGAAFGTGGMAAKLFDGKINIILQNAATNTWIIEGMFFSSDSAGLNGVFGGSKSLSGALTQLRIRCADGVSTWDAGTYNFVYHY